MPVIQPTARDRAISYLRYSIDMTQGRLDAIQNETRQMQRELDTARIALAELVGKPWQGAHPATQNPTDKED